MAVASPQQVPLYRFGNGGQASPTNLSLLNCSPIVTSPQPSVARLTSVYYASTFSKNRRSKKILERREKLQQRQMSAPLRQDDVISRSKSAPYKSASPTQAMNSPCFTPKPPPSPEKSWRSTSGDVTDRRRQEFMAKRKALIQNQVKRQLSIPVGPNKKLKTPGVGTPDIDTPSPTAENDVFRASPDKLMRVDEDTVPDLPPSPIVREGSTTPQQRPSMGQRRQSLMRTSSFSVRNTNMITRRAVNLIGQALEKKRSKKRHRLKSAKEIQEEQKNLVRKYSMMWMSKTVERKRMSSYMSSDTEDPDTLSPFNKFRRAARLVKSLIQVCKVCQDIVLDSVASEDWYKKIESFIDSTDILSQAQGPSNMRPFITFVQDARSKELVKLTFDKSMYTRERRADYLLTKEIRSFLQMTSFDRTIDQENEVLMFMKRAVPEFNSYSLDAQRRIIQCMHYDRYERDRVITRQGLTADGVYFILSGTLIEKDEDRKNLREMKPGEMFGEEDIICGCPRRNTVITHSDVELVSIHRLDYRAIVHMADDSSHPKYLDICKYDIVFQHFPMRKLMENPGVWTLLSYKYGRLIVKDSNELEWIYIIKSGEAKVLKQLRAGKIDLHERRKTITARRNQTDPHALQRKMISFVSEREYLKSQYKIRDYKPGLEATDITDRTHHSAPVLSSRVSRLQKDSKGRVKRASLRKRALLSKRLSARHQASDDDGQEMADRNGQTDEEHQGLHVEFRQLNLNSENTTETHDVDLNTIDAVSADGHQQVADTAGAQLTHQYRNSTMSNIDEESAASNHGDLAPVNASYIDTSSKAQTRLPTLDKRESTLTATAAAADEKKSKLITVPPFVQLESLHAGKVFGLRSCLHPDERGPSASLVSGGCEVLQVNKKFFMKHADEALISLIRVQYKQYPTEDELIDRLDNNFQWEEYKKSTIGDFLVQKGRMEQEELDNVTVELPGS